MRSATERCVTAEDGSHCSMNLSDRAPSGLRRVNLRYEWPQRSDRRAAGVAMLRLREAANDRHSRRFALKPSRDCRKRESCLVQPCFYSFACSGYLCYATTCAMWRASRKSLQLEGPKPTSFTFCRETPLVTMADEGTYGFDVWPR
jgi:hypothetical protein